MPRTAVLFTHAILLTAFATPALRAANEPVVGLPCEGCEAIFDGLPPTVASQTRIAPSDQPGEALRIEGVVRDPGGRPAAGIIVYAYHTDAQGIYPPGPAAWGRAAQRHGLLRGWARTDAEGRYRFDTIRPASYPDGRTPAHVHMHVLEPGRCTYYIADIHFTDDTRLSERQRMGMASGRGGGGLLEPRQEQDGTWVVTRDIRLGEGVPGWPAIEE